MTKARVTRGRVARLSRVLGALAALTALTALGLGVRAVLSHGSDVVPIAPIAPVAPATRQDQAQPETQTAPLYVLGVRDQRADEFQQGDYALDFYPDRQPVAMLAKELGLTSHPAQYVHLSLTRALADRGVSFELAPTWADGHGTLAIAAEVWRAGAWRQAATTLVSATNGGTLDLPPGFLTIGTNDLRLRAIAGSGGTTTVVWDQIVIAPSPFDTRWQIGSNDGGEHELAQDDYQAVYDVGAPSATFPKELNTTWWKTQTIRFKLSAAQAQHAAVLSLAAMWNDGDGALSVAVERETAAGWQRIDVVKISQAEPASLAIPAAALDEATTPGG